MNKLDEWIVSQIGSANSDLEGRIFPDIAPDGFENPCAVYQQIEGDPEEVLDTGQSPFGVVGYQVRIYANRRRDANGYREALGAAIENQEPEQLSGVKIVAVEFAGLQNTYEEEGGDYGALCAVRVHWER